MSPVVAVSNDAGQAVKLKVDDKVAAVLTGNNVVATITHNDDAHLSGQDSQGVQMVKHHAKRRGIPFTEAAAELATAGKLEAYRTPAASPATNEGGTDGTPGGRNFTHEQIVELSKERGISYGDAAHELAGRKG